MQIEIDPLSAVPLYQQIRDSTVDAIAAGELVPGEQLASVRQVALGFGINVQTVTKAYDALRREGFIRTNHKSGSVIARGPADPGADPGADPAFVGEWADRLATLLAEAVAQGVGDAEILGRVESQLGSFAERRAAASAAEAASSAASTTTGKS
ncbi:GntR family transcriptional regulator [Glaciibacter psychrotolerans]|uniref:DNA-binding transcriptional regulator YhcF (GntR family) n=1 Tax=Glaciibacter psychrotolerans TaxID=670054 RepID=A0A7Z0J6E6_9MICO|nr:GntR family transcriptional regulator [Leifsonia psychrotolerans]NYJ19864.1 DNA-binding transcriptional regulator YhcF (GntR family) [Leifsonia psychrotolerans]